MILLTKSWSDFKDIIDTGAIFVEQDSGSDYELYIQDGSLMHTCLITETADKTDYTTNYQDLKETMLHPVDADGKPYNRAESRPIGTQTNFALAGDTTTEIGGGDKWFADFNNTDNDVSSPPTGYKQKKITFTFIDQVWMKEGTIYWENMPFGSYVDLGFAVPDWNNSPYQGWYYKNDGTAAQNKTGSDLIIHRFSTSPMMGDCCMGDELNTEAASDTAIPAGAIGTILVTVPSTVTTSDDVHCAINMELYRERSVILS